MGAAELGDKVGQWGLSRYGNDSDQLRCLTATPPFTCLCLSLLGQGRRPPGATPRASAFPAAWRAGPVAVKLRPTVCLCLPAPAVAGTGWAAGHLAYLADWIACLPPCLCLCLLCGGPAWWPRHSDPPALHGLWDPRVRQPIGCLGAVGCGCCQALTALHTSQSCTNAWGGQQG